MFGSEPNVQVHSDTKPEPLFRFGFDGLAEPNPEHNVRFRFEHCSRGSEPDRGQSSVYEHPLTETYITNLHGTSTRRLIVLKPSYVKGPNGMR
jgi:hypothetical protein